MRLGKLDRVDLRKYWKHEALDFTRWLSEPGSIDLLSDEIGIGIQVRETEASVGRFSVDILAEEENTGRKIIIENQLELTDHGHLGQLITYAAGLEAEFIVWIVRDVREEHRQAVDWLNEHTDERINFFLVAIELWQIENSPPAPKFNVISRPNEWKRAVRTSAQDGLTDTKTKQLEFWQQLKQFATTRCPELKLRTPRPQHWFDVAIGRSDCRVALVVDSREDKVRCELYIPDSKELYRTFLSRKAEIEKELDIAEELEWQELPGKKASRICALHSFRFADTTTWEGAFGWLIETARRFKRVFAKDWERPTSE
ncbi:MAG: hypothetical protein BIP78_0619 [Candidatus Bipolaricaulis sibiricus]|uniref:DUF4268 domain-containing protein n=1 Tax=Bipolaricaulis sibiricus TaxID=2501609 RepID=A0A410FTG8_BIPS1|nr:MAG: hypothetical protein BIP78_0619 [Candidatus Bipolaricaulis sibiricus]